MTQTGITRRSFLKAAGGLALSSSLPVCVLPTFAPHAPAVEIPPLALPFPQMSSRLRVLENTLLRAALPAKSPALESVYADEIVTQLSGERVRRAGERGTAGWIDASLLQPLEVVSAPAPAVGALAFVSSSVATAHAYASPHALIHARHVHGEHAYIADELIINGVRWLGIADSAESGSMAWTRADAWRMRLTALSYDAHIDRICLSTPARTILIERAGTWFNIPVGGSTSHVGFSAFNASDLSVIGLPGGSRRMTAGAITTEPAFAYWWNQSIPHDTPVELID